MLAEHEGNCTVEDTPKAVTTVDEAYESLNEAIPDGGPIVSLMTHCQDPLSPMRPYTLIP
jgi:hypothetical protein